MLKKLVFITLAILVVSTYGQSFYTVVATEGSIRTDKSVALQPGMKIESSTRVMLNIPNSRALLIGSDSKTYEIKVPRIPSHNLVSCKSVVSKPHKSHETSSNNLGTRINGMDYNVLGDLFTIRLKDSKYPTTPGNYFFLSFNYGSKTVNYRIPVKEDQLIFLKSNIFKYSGRSLKPMPIEDATLFYHSAETNNARQVAIFDLNFLERSSIIHNESFLVKAYQDAGVTNKDLIVKKSVQFFKDAYGDFDNTQLTTFLTSIIN